MRGIKLIVLIIGLVMFSSFVSAELDDNIVAYYKMEDLTDSVGSNDLTNNGATSGATGIIDNSYSFITNDRITTTTLFWSAFSSPRTLLMWVNFDDYTPLSTNSAFSTSGVDGTITLQLSTSGILNHYWIKTTAPSWGANSYDISSYSGWHQIGFTWDGSREMHLIVDGVSVDSDTSTTLNERLTWTDIVEFGSNQGGSYLNGDIDEIGIWSRVLTTQELLDVYNSGNGLQYPFSSCGGCVYCGTGDWIIEESCHITESTKIETGYGLYVTSGYTVIIDSGVVVN